LRASGKIIEIYEQKEEKETFLDCALRNTCSRKLRVGEQETENYEEREKRTDRRKGVKEKMGKK